MIPIPDARVADDSDAQWAYLEQARVRCDRVTSRHWRAIPPQAREQIVAAVPDGYWLSVSAGYRAAPGTADVRLCRDGERGEPHRGQVAHACWLALGGGLSWQGQRPCEYWGHVTGWAGPYLICRVLSCPTLVVRVRE